MPRRPAPRRPRPRPQPLRGHTRRHSRSSTPCPRSGRAAGSRLCPTSPTCFQTRDEVLGCEAAPRSPARAQSGGSGRLSRPRRWPAATTPPGTTDARKETARTRPGRPAVTRRQVPQRTRPRASCQGEASIPSTDGPRQPRQQAWPARPPWGARHTPLKLSLPGPAPEASEHLEGTLQKGPPPPRLGGRGDPGGRRVAAHCPQVPRGRLGQAPGC